jgi:hypothetical protein
MYAGLKPFVEKFVLRVCVPREYLGSANCPIKRLGPYILEKDLNRVPLKDLCHVFHSRKVGDFYMP